jgi:uncharacterized protein YbjT (DUF2867 family)
MKIVLFGATGMVGAGALREALDAPDVEAVLSVGRRPCGLQHPKLRELVIPDLFDVAPVELQLAGYDACLWAVGVSSVGLDEAAYARLTEELTLVWARTLQRVNPVFSFCYCSAAGAGGRQMWARVRQRVEGALQSMPFRHVGVVRPGFIRPGPGITTRVWFNQAGITLLRPIFPVLEHSLPSLVTSRSAARVAIASWYHGPTRYVSRAAATASARSPQAAWKCATETRAMTRSGSISRTLFTCSKASRSRPAAWRYACRLILAHTSSGSSSTARRVSRTASSWGLAGTIVGTAVTIRVSVVPHDSMMA